MMLPREVVAVVHARAAARCQYCLMHQALQGATFHIEHIIPRSKGGADHVENLALACPSCNLRKSDRTTGVDPLTGTTVSLFHPTQQVWLDHFRFSGYRIEGMTAVGRATVAALDFNHPRRQRIRAAEQRFRLFPPAGV